MTTDAIEAYAYPTPDELRDTYLRRILLEGAAKGITYNVRVGSELYDKATTLANLVSPAIQNGKLTVRDSNPYTAQGEGLQRLITLYGVTIPPASKAQGYYLVQVPGGGTAGPILADYEITAPNGTVHKTVNITASVAGGDPVLVEALETGTNSNLDAGVVSEWNASTVTGLGLKATVAVGGIDGGADDLTEEEQRQLLLERVGFPAVGGNWAFVAQAAREASAAVNFVAVYPAAQGPGSYDVALVGTDDAPVLGSATVASVEAVIEAEMPGGTTAINATSVDREFVDCIINLDLALPETTAAVGSGWIDIDPYPSTADSALARVTAVDNTAKTITVDSTSADTPVVGRSIALYNYAASTPVMVQFTITSVTGSSGAYVLGMGLNADLSWVTTDHYVSAAAVHIQVYADLFLAAVKGLGPGEKTDNFDLLRYASRKPPPAVQRQYKLTSALLCDLLPPNRTEVVGAAFAARYATGTTTTLTTPTVPVNTALAPKQLRLRHLSFRRTV